MSAPAAIELRGAGEVLLLLLGLPPARELGGGKAFGKRGEVGLLVVDGGSRGIGEGRQPGIGSTSERIVFAAQHEGTSAEVYG